MDKDLVKARKPFNEEEVNTLLFELFAGTSFLSDTSRLLKEFHLFDQDDHSAIFTPYYIEQLAEAMHLMTSKQFALIDDLQSAIGVHATYQKENKLGLFEKPKQPPVKC